MITAQNSDSYTLAVSEVFQLGGNSSKWNGESVTIAKDGTDGYQIHRYNQTRTVVLVVGSRRSGGRFLVTTGLTGGGMQDRPAATGNPGNKTH